MSNLIVLAFDTGNDAEQMRDDLMRLQKVHIIGLDDAAVAGALAGEYADVGVDDKFIKEVGNSIQPGNSALFLLVRGIRRKGSSMHLPERSRNMLRSKVIRRQLKLSNHLQIYLIDADRNALTVLALPINV